MKNILLLAAGILLSLLYLIFGAQIYEALYYEREFSNEMYNENLYLVVCLVTVAVAWGLAAIYYYVINSVSFSRWYHWLIMLAIAAVASPVISYAYCDSVFSDLGFDFAHQLGAFCMVDLIVAAVLFTLASFALRWWSSNCRHTPIPE